MAYSAVSTSAGTALSLSTSDQSSDADLFYQTLVNCADKLIVAFAGSYLSIADRLMSNGLLQRDVYERLFSSFPEENAREMVISVCHIVQLNAEKYRELVQLLQTDVYLIDTNIAKSLHDSYLFILKKNREADKAPHLTIPERLCIPVLDMSAVEVLRTNTDIYHKQKLVTAERMKTCLVQRFSEIIYTMEGILTGSTITVDKFRQGFIHKLSVFEKQRRVNFLENKVNVISDVKSFRMLFTVLDLYWDYLNYHLLACLVREYGDSDVQRRMNEYSKNVISFMENTTLKVFWEIQPCLKSVPPPEFKEIEVRHEMGISPESTLMEVENIRLRIKKDIELNEYAMLLSRIKEGSLIISWFTTVAFYQEIESALKTELCVIKQPSLQNQVTDHDSTLKNALGESGATDFSKQQMRHYEQDLLWLCSGNYARVDDVSRVLSHGVNPNAKDACGYTALMKAAQVGNSPLVELLIKKGADVHKRDMLSGGTALHMTASAAVAEVLVDNGANVDELTKETSFCITPLIIACGTGRTKMVELLVNKGADINKQNMLGHAPLHIVSELGNTAVVKFLADNGASLDLPLECFSEWPGDKLPHFKESGVDVSELLYTAFTSPDVRKFETENASYFSASEVPVILLGLGTLRAISHYFGALINNVLSQVPIGVLLGSCLGKTALMIACQARQVSVVQILLLKGAKVNLQDKIGFSPLHSAVTVASEAIVKLLIDNGASTGIQDIMFLSTPLHWAQTPNIAKLLLDHGAKIDAQTKDSFLCYTPLYMACEIQNTDLVKLLVHRGANVNLPTLIGCAPLHVASELGNVSIVTTLIDNGAIIDLPFQLPLLAESGIDISAMWKKTLSSPDIQLLELGHPLPNGNGSLTPAKLLEVISRNCHILSSDLLSQAHIPAQRLLLSLIGNSALMMACEREQMLVIQILVLKGANVNFQNKMGISPLHIAARKGNAAIVNLLIKNGATVQFQEVLFNTPLHLASNAFVAQLLLRHGASVDSKNKNGNTPLHVAALRNDAELARTLIKYGATIDMPNEPLYSEPAEIEKDMKVIRDAENRLSNEEVKLESLFSSIVSCGNTPLIVATCKGHAAIVQLLIHEKADVNHQNKFGVTALHLARNAKVAELLIENGAKIELISNEEAECATPLIMACARGDIEVAKVLILRGACVNIQNRYGVAPLHVIVSETGNSEICGLLLDNGAQVDIHGKEKGCTMSTPLTFACMSGNTVIVKMLISRGANVSYQDEFSGFTPLHAASVGGNVDIVNLLIEKGARVDLPMKVSNDYHGNNALILASVNSHKTVVELLINKKANVNYQNKLGIAPLHAASHEGHTGVVEVLLNNGAIVDMPMKKEYGGDTALLLACIFGRTGVAKLLIKRGADIDKQNELGETPLHASSQSGHSEVAEALIDSGAQLDIPTRDEHDGNTPIIIACVNKHIAVTEILICKKANVNYQNKDGRTALFFASWEGEVQICNLLMEHKANVNTQDKAGLTCLMLATQKEHSLIVKELLSNNADPNIIETTTNWSALFFAAKNGNVEIVHMLLKGGSTKDMRDMANMTAYDIAKLHGHQNVCDVLQQTHQQEGSESIEPQEPQDTVEISTYTPLMKIFANIENKLKLLNECARKKKHMLGKSKPSEYEDMLEMNQPQTHNIFERWFKVASQSERNKGNNKFD